MPRKIKTNIVITHDTRKHDIYNYYILPPLSAMSRFEKALYELFVAHTSTAVVHASKINAKTKIPISRSVYHCIERTLVLTFAKYTRLKLSDNMQRYIMTGQQVLKK